MKPNKSGKIINIGSISGQVPRIHSTPYTTSKFALSGLTRAAALEGREHNITVSIIHPGNVLTELRQIRKEDYLINWEELKKISKELEENYKDS